MNTYKYIARNFKNPDFSKHSRCYQDRPFQKAMTFDGARFEAARSPREPSNLLRNEEEEENGEEKEEEEEEEEESE